jgi:hypothetical protein
MCTEYELITIKLRQLLGRNSFYQKNITTFYHSKCTGQYLVYEFGKIVSIFPAIYQKIMIKAG